MKRFVSIWLPNFAIDRMYRVRSDALRDQDKPLALVEGGPRGVVITAVNQAAQRNGIRKGQMLADARAILPGLITQPAEAAKDARMLYQLALWLGRYGPLRNTNGPDGLWVDVTGVAHLFGGEAGLARDCVSRLRRAGFQALLAIGDTRSAAHALARYGVMREGILIAPAGETRNAIGNLPVQSLQLTDDLVILLHRLGLKRIGQLYCLPRTALVRRFRDNAPAIAKGARGKRDPGRRPRRPTVASAAGWAEALVLRLDQALGELGEPASGIEEPPVYRVYRAYPEPLISNEGILAALEELAASLCATLEEKGEGARCLRFTLYRADGTHDGATVRTSRPVRDAHHIVELLDPRLERMDAGLGLDAIVLEALAAEPLEREQVAFAGSGDDVATDTPALLIDRLANRLGSGAVFYLDAVSSHIPERAQRRLPALQRRPRKPAQDAAWNRARADVMRPAFLLEPAEGITVIAEVRDGPPARFTWRRVTRRVARAEGPERIAPEWWRLIGLVPNGSSAARRAHLKVRDYYRIEDEYGGTYWIYRAGLYPSGQLEPDQSVSGAAAAATQGDDAVQPPAWYLHGLF